jgi:probable HAF family extracellular repeat protein
MQGGLKKSEREQIRQILPGIAPAPTKHMGRYINGCRLFLTCLLIGMVAAVPLNRVLADLAIHRRSTSNMLGSGSLLGAATRSYCESWKLLARKPLIAEEMRLGSVELLQQRDEGRQNPASRTASARRKPSRLQCYVIADIGTLGGQQSFAYGINDSGQVVGISSIRENASQHTFLYSSGKMTDLSPVNSQDLTTVGPTSINNAGKLASGLIAGGIYVPAILDTKNNSVSLLGSLRGATPYGFNGVATSVNDLGNAVGYSYVNGITRHAFLYSGGVITDIGSFGGYSAALAINNDNVIVGFASYQEAGVAHAFIYSNHVMNDIVPGTESYASDINDRGEVVGRFLTADRQTFHAFLYRGAQLTDLGFAGTPLAVNDEGKIVGTMNISSKQRAFVYENGKAVDLNTAIAPHSGWELICAFDINKHGQIVGYGLVHNKIHAFLLEPTLNRKQCHDSWKVFGIENEKRCVFANEILGVASKGSKHSGE